MVLRVIASSGAGVCSKKPRPFSDSGRRVRAQEGWACDDRRRNGIGEDHTGDLSTAEAPTVRTVVAYYQQLNPPLLAQ